MTTQGTARATITTLCDAQGHNGEYTFVNPFDVLLYDPTGADAEKVAAIVDHAKSLRPCVHTAQYAVGQPNGGERNACRAHLTLLIDESTPDWTGDIVAVRILTR